MIQLIHRRVSVLSTFGALSLLSIAEQVIAVLVVLHSRLFLRGRSIPIVLVAP